MGEPGRDSDGNFRAGGGNRTHDLMITNHLRYQLRHTG